MATKGHGCTVTFGTSAFTAELLDVSGPNVTREALDTSHMGTTNAKTFVESTLYDGGEVSLTFQYDVDDTPPITGASETVTIAFAGSGSVSFTGFMTAFGITADMEGIMQATATVKVADEITWS